MESKKLEEYVALQKRNVLDKYKDLPTEDIKKELQRTSFPAAALMSQVDGDFNFSCIIRSANSFNLSKVYYYGKKGYDRRGAVGCQNYIDIVFLSSLEEIARLKDQYTFVGLENNISKSVPLDSFVWPKTPAPLLLIGEESRGLTDEPKILELCDCLVEIKSFGSVRSLNAAVAASIAFYDYTSKYNKLC